MNASPALEREEILKYVRESIKHSIRGEKPAPFKGPDRKYGVQLNLFKEGKLRASLGILHQDFSLRDALKELTKLIVHDPIHGEITEEELSEITIELLLLSKFEEIRPRNIDDASKSIDPKKEGLIISRDLDRAYIVPEEAEEHKLGLKEYLEALCIRAGLKPEEWMEPYVKLTKFNVERIAEGKGNKKQKETKRNKKKQKEKTTKKQTRK